MPQPVSAIVILSEDEASSCRALIVSVPPLGNMARTWAGELAETAVKVNLVNPGATRTAMRAEAFPGEDPMTLKPPDAVTDIFVELAEASCTRHGEIIRA